MIFDSLDKIPVVIFFKIAETGDFTLLTDEEIEIEKLEEIWLKLFKEHESKNKTKESEKEFRLDTEISALESEYKFVLGAVYSLGFERDDELIEMLKKLRYIVKTDSTDSYYDSLEMIQRASSGFNLKISNLRSMLPKIDESKKDSEKLSIYDTMASYTRIMGYDFDYEKVSYSKFYAIQKQVHLKIESEIKQIQKK